TPHGPAPGPAAQHIQPPGPPPRQSRCSPPPAPAPPAAARTPQRPGVTIGYSAVGSSAGIAAFSAGQVDFGASDVPMTAREQAAAKGGPITQVPVALTGPVLAVIFLGQITRWNDPAITALNPGLSLPPAHLLS